MPASWVYHQEALDYPHRDAAQSMANEMGRQEQNAGGVEWTVTNCRECKTFHVQARLAKWPERECYYLGKR